MMKKSFVNPIIYLDSRDVNTCQLSPRRTLHRDRLEKGTTTSMTNIKIRIAMVECNIKQWQLAKLLNVSESTVNRLLREELPQERQDQIVGLIKEGGR